MRKLEFWFPSIIVGYLAFRFHDTEAPNLLPIMYRIAIYLSANYLVLNYRILSDAVI